jgi:hypothetical protein
MFALIGGNSVGRLRRRAGSHKSRRSRKA